MTGRRNDPARAAGVSAALPGLVAFVATVLLGCVEAVVLSRDGATSSHRALHVDRPAADHDEVHREDVVPALAAAPTVRPLVTPPPFSGPPIIRVRVARSGPGESAAFSVDGPYRLSAGAAEATGALLATGSRLSLARAHATVGGIEVNGEFFAHDAIRFQPIADDLIRVGDRSYRGDLLLERTSDGGLDVINLVDLESYLKGVLLAEMPAGFGQEALRAQAVAARTYALYHALLDNTLRADQGSQVYDGADRESAVARAVVDSTRGEVLAVDRAIFQAFFHSTCGGHTSSARDVFEIEAPVPIATGVVCGRCDTAPRYSWSRTLAPEQFRNVRPDAAGFRVTRADAAGRALRIAVLDRRGGALEELAADRFRARVGAGLTLRDQLLSTWLTRVRWDGDLIGGQVDGRGFGHGVGLCQYGSRGFAQQGATYRHILWHYYPGSAINRLYD